MSTARILLKHGDRIYRLFRFETSTDGSLLAILDRDPRPSRGRMVMNNDGMFVPEEGSDKPSPSTRFSIHTTGEVHRHLGGKKKSTIHIEPLYKLTRLHPYGFVSIPRPERLDPLETANHVVAVTLEVPETVSERINFVLEIGPNPQQPRTFGAALNYELYSAVVRVIPAQIRVIPAQVPSDVSEHFICGMPRVGPYQERQIDKANAELEFHRAAHGDRPLVFRENNGSYVLLAAVPMELPPKLAVIFDRADLRIEQIPFDHGSRPTHKVRFWICDKGGRNKTEDLRQHITGFELDAEL